MATYQDTRQKSEKRVKEFFLGKNRKNFSKEHDSNSPGGSEAFANWIISDKHVDQLQAYKTIKQIVIALHTII